MLPCNFNKWCKVPSAEHHGGLKVVFALIFHISAALDQPRMSAVGEPVSEKIEGKGCFSVRILTPCLLIYFICSPLTLSPLLTSPFLNAPSLNVFLALPSQLSLTACEVINGFHLTSSSTLRRAPTNKTRAHNTQIVPQKSSKTGQNTGAAKTMKQRDLAFGKKNICRGMAWNDFLCSLPPQRNPPTANLQLLLLPTAVSKLKKGRGIKHLDLIASLLLVSTKNTLSLFWSRWHYLAHLLVYKLWMKKIVDPMTLFTSLIPGCALTHLQPPQHSFDTYMCELHYKDSIHQSLPGTMPRSRPFNSSLSTLR